MTQPLGADQDKHSAGAASQHQLRAGDGECRLASAAPPAETELLLTESPVDDPQGNEQCQSEVLSTEPDQTANEILASCERLERRKELLFLRCAQLEQERSGSGCQAPSRLEIFQFEQRLGELFEQSALKLEQHRCHLATLNALEETLRLVDKEAMLLDSIHDSFVAAASSERKRQEFQTKFTRILSDLRARLSQHYDLREAAESAKSELEAELELKLETSRSFAKRFAEFDSVCRSCATGKQFSP